MSIKIFYSSEKTNSFRPKPWAWTEQPFPAFRGEGARHRAFLTAAKGYAPSFAATPGVAEAVGFDPTATKLIKTQEKSTLLLVPCSSEQDEQIILITLRGGFRGGYSRIEVQGGEILFNQGSNVHCCPTAHLIVRLTHPQGYVLAETGRRSSTGLVEIFSWDGYQTMPTEEFEVWRVSNAPDLTNATCDSAKAKAETERRAGVITAEERRVQAEVAAKAGADADVARKANAERMKPSLLPQLEAIARRREALGMSGLVAEELTFSFGGSYRCDYTEENVAKAGLEVTEAEVKAAVKAEFDALKKRMEGHNLAFSHDDSSYNPFFTVRKEEGYNNYFRYTPEGLKELLAVLDQLDIEAAEAKAKAEVEAEREQREAEAAQKGLPSNAEIWKRRGGATNAGDGWVVQPNGMPRLPDEMRCPRPRYPDEGTQVWYQILPGELVLSWAKAYTAAEHEFEVVYKPETLTEAQVRTVALLQEELSEERDRARGLASGLPSPPVADGWGLLPKEQPNPTVTPVAQGGESVSKSQLDALRAHFGK